MSEDKFRSERSFGLKLLVPGILLLGIVARNACNWKANAG
jgi:hypothetical protein